MRLNETTPERVIYFLIQYFHMVLVVWRLAVWQFANIYFTMGNSQTDTVITNKTEKEANMWMNRWLSMLAKIVFFLCNSAIRRWPQTNETKEWTSTTKRKKTVQFIHAIPRNANCEMINAEYIVCCRQNRQWSWRLSV